MKNRTFFAKKVKPLLPKIGVLVHVTNIAEEGEEEQDPETRALGELQDTEGKRVFYWVNQQGEPTNEIWDRWSHISIKKLELK